MLHQRLAIVPSSPGGALFMTQSHVTIYDGYFEGGTFTRPPTLQGTTIEVDNGSMLEIHGGTIDGLIILTSSTFIVYGSNLNLIDQSAFQQTVTGTYTNGEPFTHTVQKSFPQYVTITENYIVISAIPIPEPSSIAVLAIGVSVWALSRRSRRRSSISSRTLLCRRG